MDPSKRSSISSTIISIFHVFAAVQFSYSVYYDYMFVLVPKDVFPIMSAFGGKFKFLTFWDAILQALYFTVCFLLDITNANQSKVGKIKDFIHSSLAFPVAMFVGVTFWGLYGLDRELVLPQKLDVYFPTWLNHVMHTNIMFFTLIELLITYRKYPSRRRALAALVTFQLTYIAWMHVVHYKSGFWVYNIFNLFSVAQRGLFILVCILLTCTFYYIGEKINNLVWGAKGRQSTKQKKHK